MNPKLQKIRGETDSQRQALTSVRVRVPPCHPRPRAGAEGGGRTRPQDTQRSARPFPTTAIGGSPCRKGLRLPVGKISALCFAGACRAHRPLSGRGSAPRGHRRPWAPRPVHVRGPRPAPGRSRHLPGGPGWEGGGRRPGGSSAPRPPAASANPGTPVRTLRPCALTDVSAVTPGQCAQRPASSGTVPKEPGRHSTDGAQVPCRVQGTEPPRGGVTESWKCTAPRPLTGSGGRRG